MNDFLVTIFTPSYNRAKTLPELYDSLLQQTYRNFEWIIVNDGSNDNTNELVEKWLKENRISIVYIEQSNNGKHIAMNVAVAKAKGILFTTVDSDDYLIPNALKILVDVWKRIPEDEWELYSSVKSKCFDATTGEKLGKTIPGKKMVSSYLDATYKFKLKCEMQALTRIDVLKEFPNPAIMGGPQNGGLRFYPESIWQELAARKYKTIFIEEATCAYRQDSSESLLGRGKKYDRYRENIYLWYHIINDNFDYFWWDPKQFIKAYIGITMDSIFNGYSLRKMFGLINSPLKRYMLTFFLPLGYVAYLMKK